MSNTKIRPKKPIRCKFCGKLNADVDTYVAHIEKKHDNMIPPDMTPYQFYYVMKTNKTHGDCVMCKKPTTWNDKTNKYNRFCGNPACKDKYVEVFRTRMIGKYGKVTLLNDPDHQRKMLANRSISGRYTWSNREGSLPYTGSYELNFLQFLDECLDYNYTDIMAPSPHTYYYIYEGERKFYIPDFFIPSLNLEIEIKDGGDNPNTHHKIQDVDKVKEHLKDEVMKSSKFNYIKIVNKENERFLDFLYKMKFNEENGITKPIIMI